VPIQPSAAEWGPSMPKAGPFRVLDFEPMVGLSLPGSNGRAGPRAAKKQRVETIQIVSARIARNIAGHAQVLVKITSKGYNHGQARAHAAYITRHGKLTAEDELGFVLGDSAAVREKLDAWRLTPDSVYLDPERTHKLRQTLHFTFGMPAGTDPNKVLEGTRRFAQREFADHQYIMVLHEPASDPKPGAPEHPHVHISVRALSETQRRLQVNPDDLLYFREAFAEQMRALGVEANASSRLERLQPKRGDTLAQRRRKERQRVEIVNAIGDGKHRLKQRRMVPDFSLPAGNQASAFELAREDYLTLIRELKQQQRRELLTIAERIRSWVDQIPSIGLTREQVDERAQALRASLDSKQQGNSPDDERTR
jgi:type IV secretion system T-DNA border endonuclease VirD2